MTYPSYIIYLRQSHKKVYKDRCPPLPGKKENAQMNQQKINSDHNLHLSFVTAKTLEEHTAALNEMFVNEPKVTPNDVKVIMEAMLFNGWSKEDVMEAKKKYPKKRIWRIVGCKKKQPLKYTMKFSFIITYSY